jgi:hypothetical protein
MTGLELRLACSRRVCSKPALLLWGASGRRCLVNGVEAETQTSFQSLSPEEVSVASPSRRENRSPDRLRILRNKERTMLLLIGPVQTSPLPLERLRGQ